MTTSAHLLQKTGIHRRCKLGVPAPVGYHLQRPINLSGQTVMDIAILDAARPLARERVLAAKVVSMSGGQRREHRSLECPAVADILGGTPQLKWAVGRR